MSTGLTGAGVDPAAATRASHASPVGTLFAAFLGDNPVKAAACPNPGPGVDTSRRSTASDFFPNLISDPFRHGLLIAFTASIIMLLIAAARLADARRAVHPRGRARRRRRCEATAREGDALRCRRPGRGRGLRRRAGRPVVADDLTRPQQRLELGQLAARRGRVGRAPRAGRGGSRSDRLLLLDAHPVDQPGRERRRDRADQQRRRWPSAATPTSRPSVVTGNAVAVADGEDRDRGPPQRVAEGLDVGARVRRVRRRAPRARRRRRTARPR